MSLPRQCTECGATLAESQSESLCAACIFQRLSRLGSISDHPNQPAPFSPEGASTEHDTDFYNEYELLGEIGRGGMGVIYKAHQASVNRVVALKVIHASGHAGESARRRFQAEVEVAARLSHPNIVPIFDTGEMDGCPCFSMEYFSAGTLAARTNDFVADPEAGVRLLVKVARAVAFAHQRGVLHRDLKPANILLDETGEPHVADFGLAKLMDSDTDLTRTGAVIGSPNFMSPEQAAGKSHALTVATDVYSLGAILYQLLTGRPPFVAETPLDTMRLVIEQEPQHPSTLATRTDRDLGIICLKCLQKEPARRYRSAEDLADDLERWLRHEPILARPVSGWERFQKWVRRHPALAVMNALLLVVLMTGMGGVLWQWRRAEQARRGEAFERRRAEEALARSSIALAESAIRDGNTPAARAALDAVPADRRNATWHYLFGESDTSRSLAALGLQTVDDIAGDPSRPSVFAAAERSGRIVLFDARTQSRLLEFTPGFTQANSNVMLRLAFSRDGRKMVVGRKHGSDLVIHNGRDGQKISEWEAPQSERLEFSPDATLILQTVGSRVGTILWDVNGKQRWNHKDGGLNSSAFTTDPSWFVHYSWNRQLHLAGVADRSIGLRLATSGYFDNFAIQPGGDVLAVANPLGFVRGYSLTNGQQRFEFQPHEGAIEYIAFLPGGERFLTAAKLQDGRQALQCWESRNGRACQTLTGGYGKFRCIALHPLSGELIVCGQQEVRIWDLAALPPMRTIRSRNAHPSAVFWGDDETIFAPDDDGGTSSHLRSDLSGSGTLLWRSPDPDLGQPGVSVDGRRAVIGRYNSSGAIYLLERKDGAVKQIASLNPRCMISHLRLSPTGDRVAILQSDLGALIIVDVDTNKRGVKLEVPDMTGFSDVAWLKGGATLAGLVTTHAPRSTPGAVEQVILWDMATGRRVQSVTNSSVPKVACAAPDGGRFAEAGADRNVRIRDGATLAVLREMRVHNAPITALAWHPTRPILATASEDLVIRLWNLDTGERLEELRGPLSPPSVLSFSPSGTRLATASRDQVARIWEPRSLAPQTAQK